MPTTRHSSELTRAASSSHEKYTDTMNHFIIISGCSGGGKSTLLAEFQQREYTVVEEPGRRIVQEQTCSGGQALPWHDMPAFLRRAIDVALDDHANAPRGSSQWVVA